MRSVFLAASLLLLFVACKPVARGPVSGLEAVTDGNLTLGMVPVEDDDGVQAYRLLVCRKSDSYPKWMLEDTNRCRHALLNETGSEIVFMHDDFERGFATKYAGYAQGYIAPVLVGVVAAAAVAGAGKWVGGKTKAFSVQEGIKDADQSFFVKKAKGIKEYWNNDDKLKFVKKVLGVRHVVHRGPAFSKVAAARYRAMFALDRTGKLTSVLRVSTRVSAEAFKEARHMVDVTSDLDVLRYEQGLLTDLKKVADDAAKRTEHTDKLKKDLDDLKGIERQDGNITGPKSNEKFTMLDANGKLVEADDASQALGSFQIKMANLPEDHPDRIDGLLRQKKIKVLEDDYIAKINDDNFNQAEFFNMADDATTTNKTRLDTLASTAEKEAPEGSIQAAGKVVLDAKIKRQYSPLGVKYSDLGSLALKGAAGVALVTMTGLDKSVWGYADRQTSVHWSQVFSESMESENKVKDMSTLLRSFADFFGYLVNPQALALGK